MGNRRRVKMSGLLAVSFAVAGVSYSPSLLASRVLVGLEPHASADEAVSPVAITGKAVPTFPVQHYSTSGDYPQISGDVPHLDAANDAIRNVVLENQEQYKPAAQRRVKQLENEGWPTGALGTYQISPDSSLISASSAVVSALLPSAQIYPGDTDGQGWVPVTVDVATGSIITISSLFSDYSTALTAIAKATEQAVLHGTSAADECLQASYKSPTPASVVSAEEAGLAPQPDNYGDIALSPSGLLVGLTSGQAASESCGRIEVTISYATVRPYLDKLGQQLVAGARSPLSVKM